MGAMTQMFWVTRCTVLACLAIALLAGPMNAQSRFSPIIEVGDDVITRYQLDQRARFLALLRAPGDPRELARDQLINEAIQMSAAEAIDINIGSDNIQAGMTEFAARANLTADQFVTALAQNGVDEETFRDFVAAGLAWREYSRSQFADDARDIPRVQVERTLARTGTEGGLRVLVSEILLPATSPETTRISRERAAQFSQITSESEFATAARQFSVSASKARGGELSWVSVDTLPPEVQGTIAALSPGQASRPIELGNAIGVFFLRDAERATQGTPDDLSVDYALFFTGGTSAEATRVSNELDTCDDLYGVAKGLPEERLIREQVQTQNLPSDVRQAIQSMDINETATLMRDSGAAVLMLCGRTAALESEVDFDLVSNRLLNSRLTAIATDELANLRANTYVRILSN